MSAKDIVERLALEYVRVKATPEMSPTDLLRLYNDAFSELYPLVMSCK